MGGRPTWDSPPFTGDSQHSGPTSAAKTLVKSQVVGLPVVVIHSAAFPSHSIAGLACHDLAASGTLAFPWKGRCSLGTHVIPRGPRPVRHREGVHLSSPPSTVDPRPVWHPKSSATQAGLAWNSFPGKLWPPWVHSQKAALCILHRTVKVKTGFIVLGAEGEFCNVHPKEEVWGSSASP